jgi:hypothetical protein
MQSSLSRTASTAPAPYSAGALDPYQVVKAFHPQFLEIYRKYREARGEVPCASNHLMAICMSQLVPFCLWVRSSTENMAWIKTIVSDNPDFRPEVRNGIAMLVMYTMATVKAHEMGTDVFTEMLDCEHGFGIVNKSSLKIYNDPFKYFEFLKCCITGLIDAGEIPENERVNQVRITVCIAYAYTIC